MLKIIISDYFIKKALYFWKTLNKQTQYELGGGVRETFLVTHWYTPCFMLSSSLALNILYHLYNEFYMYMVLLSSSAYKIFHLQQLRTMFQVDLIFHPH